MNQNFKKISSIVFLALAIVLSGEALKFFVDILSIRNDIAKYNEENARLAGTKEKIDLSLSITQKNPEIITKFNIILPDNDGMPNFMSAMESIALQSGVFIKKIGFPKSDSQPQAVGADGSNITGDYESQAVDIDFSGGYSALKNFLTAIENSLKMTDVVSVVFKSAGSSNEGNVSRSYEFNVKLRTYWQASENKEKLSAFLDTANFGDFSFIKGRQFTGLISPPGYSITIDKSVELNNPMPF